MSALHTVRLIKLRPARPTVGAPQARGFAVSAPTLKSGNKLASSSSATTLLAQKLRAEISYEAEVRQDDVQEGGWEIKATPADDEAFLTRNFGDKRCVMLSFPHFRLITSG
ncbi:hypothetical protein B0H14DRAFT_3456147 [Mycena olivaceomarginata]|nr:hypothetical protein B0H14DRAFT_3493980 [Mycena olivaceomarginata]KAJ7843573.1 hypothetical protein B0H14DRAFT_3456147 [Mycena olivaceomarginata]